MRAVMWAVLVVVVAGFMVPGFMVSGGAWAAAGDPSRVGEVSTTFRVLGRNDKIVVDRHDDPRV